MLSLAGCATGYGPKDATGGYSDEKLDESHYRVKFNGNGYASQERVWSFWIYRCAEITGQQGYRVLSIAEAGPVAVDGFAGRSTSHGDARGRTWSLDIGGRQLRALGLPPRLESTHADFDTRFVRCSRTHPCIFGWRCCGTARECDLKAFQLVRNF